MGVYLMGEFTGLNGLMLSDSPYDIHNLCGDYTETTIFAISISRNPCIMKDNICSELSLHC